MKNYINLALLSMFLLGCAHVPKKTCVEKNWFDVGKQDAEEGQSRRDMSMVASSCKRFQLKNPPEIQYQGGYEAGLINYCTEERGKALGASGHRYPTICSTDRFSKLLASWKKSVLAYWEKQGFLDGRQGNPQADITSFAKPVMTDSEIVQLQDLYKKSYHSGLIKYCTLDQGILQGEKGLPKGNICEGINGDTYFKGYQQGVRVYCAKPNLAYRLGREGKTIFRGCPHDLEPAFKSAYQKGDRLRVKITNIRDELSSVNSRISALNEKADAVEKDIAKFQNRITQIDEELIANSQRARSLRERITKVTEEDKMLQSVLKRDLSSEKHELLRSEDKKSELNQEKSRITSVNLPNLYQQRTQISFDLATARQEKIAYESQLRTLEAESE